MRAARRDELKQNAFPVMTAELSEAELTKWFPDGRSERWLRKVQIEPQWLLARAERASETLDMARGGATSEAHRRRPFIWPGHNLSIGRSTTFQLADDKGYDWPVSAVGVEWPANSSIRALPNRA